MNRDRLEKELTRFEEEILSGLDKPPLPLPEQFHIPANPLYPNAHTISMPEQTQYHIMPPPQVQPALNPSSFQTFIDPAQHFGPTCTSSQPIQPVSRHDLIRAWLISV